MPQYIRENGAIKVIPDDNTTEDGEIDLSPRRKIIDEGDIIIEGRDDGSTVIREKRVSDHTFFEGEPQIIEIEDSERGRIINLDYIPHKDLFVYNLVNENYMGFLDAETISFINSIEVTEVSKIKSTLYHEPTKKLFAHDSDESTLLRLFETNNSTGNFEYKDSIDLSSVASETVGIHYIKKVNFLNLLVIFGSEQTIFFDPINETVVDEVSTSVGGGISSQAVNSIPVKRSDRFLVVGQGNNSLLVDPVSKTVNDISDLFPSEDSVVDMTYVPRLDIFYVFLSDATAYTIDGSTLEIKNGPVQVTNPAYTDIIPGIDIAEDRFVFSPESGRDIGAEIKLVDPKDLSVVGSINSNEPKDIAFDSKRKRLLFPFETEGFFTDVVKFGLIEYNPFYD